MNILAVIPARGGSKGLIRKNLCILNCKPLIQYTLDAAKGSAYLTDIIVTTEDKEIKNYSKNYVKVQDRPEEHATDIAEVDPLLIYTVGEYEKQYNTNVNVVVLLYPTSPLRTSQIIDDCIDVFIKENYDSLLTLHEYDEYIWKVEKDCAVPINYDPLKRAPRQLEGWNQYVENKMVYVMKWELLKQTGCRLGGKIGYHKIDPLYAIDIDDKRDLKLAELIMNSM